MKVFISWSGPTSRAVAETLRRYLPVIINRVEPWLSTEDIGKGARWHNELAAQLRETQVGILCLTKDNLSSLWLLFEAGALSQSLAQDRICPYLIGVEPTEIVGPLVEYQAARANREDSRRLLDTINQALPPGEALDPAQLDIAFNLAWPALEQDIAGALAGRAPEASGSRRRDRDLIEELLTLARNTERRSYTLGQQFDSLAAAVLGLAIATVGYTEPDEAQPEAAGQRLESAIRHLMQLEISNTTFRPAEAEAAEPPAPPAEQVVERVHKLRLRRGTQRIG